MTMTTVRPHRRAGGSAFAALRAPVEWAIGPFLSQGSLSTSSLLVRVCRGWRAGGGFERRFAGPGAALLLGAAVLIGGIPAAGAGTLTFTFSDDGSNTTITPSGSLDLSDFSKASIGTSAGNGRIIMNKPDGSIRFQLDYRSNAVTIQEFDIPSTGIEGGCSFKNGTSWRDDTFSSLRSAFFLQIRPGQKKLGLNNSWLNSANTAYTVPSNASAASVSGTLSSVMQDDNFFITVTMGDEKVVFRSASATTSPATPTGLKAVEGDAQVALEWANPNDSDILKYQIRQKEGEGRYGAWGDIDSSSASTTSHLVTGLTNDTTYAFQVRALRNTNTCYASKESAEVTATPHEGPGQPQGFAATPGDRRVTLTWDDQSDDDVRGGIGKFQYRQRTGTYSGDGADGTPITISWGDYGGWVDIPVSNDDPNSDREHVLSSRANNTPYGYELRAVSAGGSPGEAAESLSATPHQSPEAPRNFSLTPGENSVTLQWDKPPNVHNDVVSEYQYRQSKDDRNSWGDWVTVPGNPLTTREYSVTGLENGDTYYFMMRTVTAVHVGTQSHDDHRAPGTTPDLAPAKPALGDLEPGDRTVKLAWTYTANDPVVANWQYRQKVGDAVVWGAWTDIAGSHKDTREHTVTGLANAKKHEFQVRGRTSAGVVGAESDAKSARPAAPPAKPAKPTAEAGNTQVTLIWTDPGNADIQKYQYEQNGDGTWVDMSESDATTTTYVVKGLTNGTAYTFKVRAVTVGGEGPESDASDSATPNAAPGQPQNFRLEPGNATITLRWDDQSSDEAGIAKWQYQEKIGDADWPAAWTDFGGIDRIAKDITSFARSSLTNGTRYGYRLRAVAAGDVFGPVSEEKFATPAGPPAAATLTATGEPRQVTLSWTLDADDSIESWEYQQLAGAISDPADFASVAWKTVPESDKSTRSHTVRGLESATAYSFRIRAVGYGGDGTESNVITATTLSGPAAATLSAAAGPRRVTLSWTLDPADAGIEKWQYQKREGATSDPNAFAGVAWTDIPGSGAATRSHTVRGLKGDTAYSFRIRAVSEAGDGAESDIVTVTPEAGPAAEEERQLLEPTLAAVAQATLSGAAETLGQRLDAAPGTRALTLAGRQLGGASLSPETGAFGLPTAPALETAPRVASDQAGRRSGDASYAVDREALLRGSAFALPLAGAEAGAGGRNWTVWGRGDWRSFEGRMNGDSWDGKQRTGWLGVDARMNPRLTAGLAVSRGDSEADYRLEEFQGRLDTSVTALWPYFQVATGNGGTLQLVLGAGTGEVEHRKFDGTEEKEDLSLLAGSVSGRMPLARMGAASLSALAGASLAEIETDGSSSTSSVGGLTAGSWSLRGGLEAEHDGVELASGSGWLFRPHGALALRQDGGDGVTGTGVEVSGGVRLTSPGSRFGLDASGHWLALHSEDGKREMGASLEARLAPAADGRGLSLSVGPAWGKQGIGALTRERLFDAEGGGDAPERLSLTARTAYGFEAAGGLLTPFADMSIVEDSNAQRYRAGVGFARDGIDADLTAGHRAGGEPDTRIGLNLQLRY